MRPLGLLPEHNLTWHLVLLRRSRYLGLQRLCEVLDVGHYGGAFSG
jgi:hypothetical protein